MSIAGVDGIGKPLYPVAMPLTLLFSHPLVFVAWVFAIVFGITIHEFAHVFAAYVQGDPTGKERGRLTLNPLVHIDPLGLVALLVAGFGWGRPAPFNPSFLKRPRLGTLLIALAGPIANLLAITVFGLVFRFLLPSLSLDTENLLVIFLVFLIQVNLILMVFNLIPIPPLDGSRILFALLPKRYMGVAFALERYGPFLLIGLLLFGGSLLSNLFVSVNLFASRIIGG